MPHVENDIALEKSVIHVLTYFDLFNYPLTNSEIHRFSNTKSSLAEIDEILEILTMQNNISRSGNLFSLQFTQAVFARRRAGNTLADSLLPHIQQKAALIFKFPFVRSVMASGSFSKNFMDENSDFDFFIVCAPGRIWISRMLLVIYKRIFLSNSHKHFCVNYFIDEESYELGEKNIFTATELATVLPLNGFDCYEKLMASNRGWLSATLPNYSPRMVASKRQPSPLFKKLLEFTLSLAFAPLLNKVFKWITQQKWKRTYGKVYSPSDFNIAFKSTNSVSKNHPQNFQKKILALYHERLNRLGKNVEAA